MRIVHRDGILSRMRSPQDPRRSTALNAFLTLVLALVPLSFSVQPRPLDHRDHRPWGCQTCPIPPEPADELSTADEPL
jgi:hypothetical protein